MNPRHQERRHPPVVMIVGMERNRLAIDANHRACDLAAVVVGEVDAITGFEVEQSFATAPLHQSMVLLDDAAVKFLEIFSAQFREVDFIGTHLRTPCQFPLARCQRLQFDSGNNLEQHQCDKGGQRKMALSFAGIRAKLVNHIFTIPVGGTHPLILLANALPWEKMSELAASDLKATTAKGQWWRGRRLEVRTHLGAYVIQMRFNKTDRAVEEEVRYNAAYQHFCGAAIVPGWRPPDHTKIEEFRNRLSPETHREIGNLVIGAAQQLGFADPSWMDVDSTVQEANISYPSDASLMVKLAKMGQKVWDFLKSHTRGLVPDGVEVDLAELKKKAAEYFFKTTSAKPEEKRDVFRELHRLAKQVMRPVVELCESVDYQRYRRLPWNIKRAFDTILADGWRYLLDVAHFVRVNKMKPGKILSFHARDVACIKKGKVSKPFEFGRVFQLARIGGNFMFALGSDKVKPEDKTIFPQMLAEHTRLFGEGVLQSVGADKGYFSAANVRSAKQASITEIGLQRPGKDTEMGLTPERAVALRGRRAGIEPLIGHAKRLGLSKSRMKSDRGTHAAGYRAVSALNLCQLQRHLSKEAAAG